MEKPKKEDYGWHDQHSFDDDESGWLLEGGEEAYNEALEAWEKKTPKYDRFVICKQSPYNHLLKIGKKYPLLAEHNGNIVIIDETGEIGIYDSCFFETI
jgi:hypothetical protein